MSYFGSLTTPFTALVCLCIYIGPFSVLSRLGSASTSFRRLSPKDQLGIDFKPTSKYAYATLLDDTTASSGGLGYRALVLSILVMKHSLDNLSLARSRSRATIDLVVLHGFDTGQTSTQDSLQHNSLIASDLAFLAKCGIKVQKIPALGTTEEVDLSQQTSSQPLKMKNRTILEVTLEKLYLWGLSAYDKVQFLDADIMPIQSLDCFFTLEVNTFEIGTVSPINAGWMLTIPEEGDFQELKRLAEWRLTQGQFNVNLGYGLPMPSGLLSGFGTRPFSKWSFHGAELEQGLLVHHFAVQDRQKVLQAYGSSHHNYLHHHHHHQHAIDKGGDCIVVSSCELWAVSRSDTTNTHRHSRRHRYSRRRKVLEEVSVSRSSSNSQRNTFGSDNNMVSNGLHDNRWEIDFSSDRGFSAAVPTSASCSFAMLMKKEKAYLIGNSSLLIEKAPKDVLGCCRAELDVILKGINNASMGDHTLSGKSSLATVKIDDDMVRSFNGELAELRRRRNAAHADALRPSARFTHFTGVKKPWYHFDLPSSDRSSSSPGHEVLEKAVSTAPPTPAHKMFGEGPVINTALRKEWARRLDFLGLNANSTHIHRFLVSNEPLRFL